MPKNSDHLFEQANRLLQALPDEAGLRAVDIGRGDLVSLLGIDNRHASARRFLVRSAAQENRSARSSSSDEDPASALARRRIDEILRQGHSSQDTLAIAHSEVVRLVNQASRSEYGCLAARWRC
jgi:hypothetical protein